MGKKSLASPAASQGSGLSGCEHLKHLKHLKHLDPRRHNAIHPLFRVGHLHPGASNQEQGNTEYPPRGGDARIRCRVRRGPNGGQ